MFLRRRATGYAICERITGPDGRPHERAVAFLGPCRTPEEAADHFAAEASIALGRLSVVRGRIGDRNFLQRPQLKEERELLARLEKLDSRMSDLEALLRRQLDGEAM